MAQIGWDFFFFVPMFSIEQVTHSWWDQVTSSHTEITSLFAEPTSLESWVSPNISLTRRAALCGRRHVSRTVSQEVSHVAAGPEKFVTKTPECSQCVIGVCSEPKDILLNNFCVISLLAIQIIQLADISFQPTQISIHTTCLKHQQMEIEPRIVELGMKNLTYIISLHTRNVSAWSPKRFLSKRSRVGFRGVSASTDTSAPTQSPARGAAAGSSGDRFPSREA